MKPLAAIIKESTQLSAVDFYEMRVKQYSQIEPKSLYEPQIQQELTRLRQIAYPSSGLLIQQPPKPQPIYNWKLPPTHVPYDYER